MMIPTMTLTALNNPSVGFSDTLAAMMVADRTDPPGSRAIVGTNLSVSAVLIVNGILQTRCVI